MSEYWVSQAKKHCDFCKCWIADNKPSRDFHERGKRHQDNVKKKIEDVRQKCVLKAQQDQEMSDSLREMEENALKALKRDLIKNPSMASQYGVKLKPKPPPKPYGPEMRPQSSETAKEGDTDSEEKKEGEADSKKEKEGETEEKPEVAEGTWHMAASEQGYPYYWNDITSEVSWVPPAAYLTQQEEAATAISGDVELEEEDDDDEDDDEDDKKSSTSPSDEEKQNEEVPDPVPTIPTTPVARPAVQPEHRDMVKRPKQPQPKMYKLQEPSCKKPRLETPLVLADIPLPGEITPGTGSETAGEANGEGMASEDETRRQSGSTRQPKSNAAYGTWAQVEQEVEPEDIDLGLPEPANKGEPFVTVPVAEPRFKIREKTVSSLGSGPVFFKKPKKKITAAQFLKKREES